MLSFSRNPRRAIRRHFATRRPGQALVEFCLVSIVMILILATVADFGRLFYAQITVENAARAGALVAAREPASYTGACPGAVTPTNKIGCAIAAESRGSGSTVAASEVTVSCQGFDGSTVSPCPATPQPSVRSKVTIVKSFGFVMPVLTAIFGNSITITATVSADQQSLPANATFVPVPSASAAPSVAPSVLPSVAPSALPSVAPSVAPSAAPCQAGYAPVPNLVVGATPGSTETVAEARAEWLTAGFQANQFIPSSGSTNKIVTSQFPNDVGLCKSVTTYAVAVTHT
jgi:hypothetical protein